MRQKFSISTVDAVKQSLTRIEVFKESMKFSAAHFTIFSATERERLHGHNFSVYTSVEAPVGPDGMCFSYQELKKRVRRLCRELDEYTLLPDKSPHLSIIEDGVYYQVGFADDTMYFLKSDTRRLPIRNSTVEEYSRYLLERLISDRRFIDENDIREVVVKVSSGPGQSGLTSWRSDDPPL